MKREMTVGISVYLSALDKACELLDRYPDIKHVQIKLPNEIPEHLHLEDRVAALREKYPLAELSFHGSTCINFCEQSLRLRRASLDYAADTVRLASSLGGRFVVFHAGYVQGHNARALRAAARAALADSAEQLLEVCTDAGIDLHLENIYPAPFRSELERLLDRAEDYEYLISALEHERLSYCYDYGHAAIDCRGGILEAIGCPGSVHLHENDGLNDLHLPPTLVDWHAELARLKAAGFTGPVIAETDTAHLEQAASAICGVLHTL